jgi:hypothetical protein
MNRSIFDIGDKVNCKVYGEGTVTAIKGSDKGFAVVVTFERKESYFVITYTFDGKLDDNSEVCLTRGRWLISEEYTEHNIKYGDPVLYSNNGKKWFIGFFVGLENNKFVITTDADLTGPSNSYKYCKKL